MFSPKDLDLAPPRAHPLDEPIRLVGLAARLAHLRDDDVRVEPAVDPFRDLEDPGGVRHGLDADEHVLFRVVQPVARAPCADDALELSDGVKSVVCAYGVWREREGRRRAPGSS